jgi:uncharacterized protein with PQ loop repeat
MKTKKQTNILIGAFLVSAILISLFVIYPILKDIQNGSKNMVSEKNQSLELDERIASLERFKVVYKSLQEILNKMDALFVRAELPVDFIDFLERTARSCSVDIDISPISSDKKPNDLWPSIGFQVISSGSFPNLQLFLEKIENSPFLVEIWNLTVSKTSGSGNVSTLFSLKVFSK